MFPALDSLSLARQIEIIEENALDGCRVWASWPRFQLHQDEHFTWSTSEIPFFLFNNVFSSRVEEDVARQAIPPMIARFTDRQVPFAWWVGPTARPADLTTHLQEGGLILAGTNAGMIGDLRAAFPESSSASGVTIQEVFTEDELRCWCELMTGVYEFPSFAIEPWFELHASLGLGPGHPWRHYLAWKEERPLATASLYLGKEAASVANVSTLPEYRRQGLGTAVTVVALRQAQQLGFKLATLCSSPEAENLYARLGFVERCRLAMLVSAPS